MPVILATQEAEIRMIMVQSQPEQIVLKTPSQKNQKPKQTLKKRAGGVAQSIGPKFKPQCHTKKKKVNAVESENSCLSSLLLCG
jgi:hypothetical protein